MAEALGEFGAGVKRRESEELLAGTNRSLPVLGNPSYKVNQVRSRAGSLGRDPRLIGELEEGGDEWGVQVENVRLGECSALTGEGKSAYLVYPELVLICQLRRGKVI